MSFSDHGVNREVVDNVENYLNVQFQPKVMTRSQENGQKTIFWKIAYNNKLAKRDQHIVEKKMKETTTMVPMVPMLKPNCEEQSIPK